MLKSSILVVVALSLGSPSARAEAPGPLPGFMQLYAQTRGFSLGRPLAISPAPDGKTVLFLRSPPKEPVLRLYEYDVASGQTKELVTPQQLLKGAEEKLSVEERARRERMRITLGGFAGFDLSPDGKVVLLHLSGKLYAFDRATGDVVELPIPAGVVLDSRFSPDGTKIAYVRDNDLRVMDLATRKERTLTTGGSELLTHGLAEFVAQEEMDRMRGYWWSPDSDALLYEEADHKDVEEFFIQDPMHPEQKPNAYRYPRAGKKNAVVRLGIVPLKGGKTTWLSWDSARYPYVAAVGWEKNTFPTVLVQNRLQREEVLLGVDAKTGKTRELLVEKDPAWINIDAQMPMWLEDGSAFLWTTERNGAWELELHDRDGKPVRTIVDARAGMVRVISVDSKKGEVYFLSAPRPEDAQLHKVSLDAGAPIAMGEAGGRRTIVFAKNHSIYVETKTSRTAFRKVEVHSADGALLGELPAVNVEPPFKPNIEWMTVGTGAGLHAAVIRPRVFTPGRKLPVIVSVYGGPHYNIVGGALDPYLREQWFADHGFIVVLVDGRGTPKRGRAWERAIAGDFSTVPLQDQVTGLKLVAGRVPEMDLKRVGIIGWSFGGYMSALAVLKRPDVFHAAVAGAPVVDWADYDTHYTERYLGLPDENAEGYRKSSLLTHAPELSRPLLIIHGTADDNVYFFHSLKLSNALMRAGRPHVLLPLSGFTHMVPDPVVSERLWMRQVQFLSDNLSTGAGP